MMQKLLEEINAPRGHYIPSNNEPQIHVYDTKDYYRTSETVNGFIYNAKKYGKLTIMSEVKILELAECYLQGKADKCIMRLECHNQNPTTSIHLSWPWLENSSRKMKFRYIK